MSSRLSESAGDTGLPARCLVSAHLEAPHRKAVRMGTGLRTDPHLTFISLPRVVLYLSSLLGSIQLSSPRWDVSPSLSVSQFLSLSVSASASQSLRISFVLRPDCVVTVHTHTHTLSLSMMYYYSHDVEGSSPAIDGSNRTHQLSC